MVTIERFLNFGFFLARVMGTIGPNEEGRNRHVILIGGSTGAPRYIFQFLDRLNALVKSRQSGGHSIEYPPVAIAVHHTKALDDTLGLTSFERTFLNTRFIDDGMEVGSSGVYICRGGALTQIQRNKRARVISNNGHPTPSIDLFFESAANYLGLSPIIIIYSGNEFDGASSPVEILSKNLGSALIVQYNEKPGNHFAPNLPQEVIARVNILDSGEGLERIAVQANVALEPFQYKASKSFKDGRVYVAKAEDIPAIAFGICGLS